MNETGAHIAGDANTGGGSFAGRDQRGDTQQNTFNVNASQEDAYMQHLDQLSTQMSDLTEQVANLSAVVLRLVVLIDGDPTYDSVGMRLRLKNTMLRSNIALVISVLSFILWLVSLWS